MTKNFVSITQLVLKNCSGLLLLFFFAGNILAQTSSGDSLLQSATLDNLIRYAIKNNPQINQYGIDEEITDLQVKSKLADWYPQVNFGYVYQHNFQVQTNIIGGNPVRLGVNNTSALQFSLNQQVFNRDVLLAKRTRSDVKQLAGQQTAAAKTELVASVSKAFYDVLATEEQIKVINENIVRLEASLKDALAQYNAGIKDKTDYKRATIALNNAKATKSSTAELLKARQEYLRLLINYPESGPLHILYDSSTLEDEILLDTLGLPDFRNRPEYAILETQRSLQEANLRYAKWSYLPSVSVNAAYNLNFLNNDFGKLYSQNFPNSYAGLTLNLPLFQGGKRKHTIGQAEWQLRKTNLEITRVTNLFSTEYSSVLAEYKSNLIDYAVLKENVVLAGEVYDVINLQYRAGIKTYLEVIAAEADLRTSRINYFNALYRVLSSKINVLKAKGELSY